MIASDSSTLLLDSLYSAVCLHSSHYDNFFQRGYKYSRYSEIFVQGEVFIVVQILRDSTLYHHR